MFSLPSQYFLQLKLPLSHFLPLNNLYSGEQFPQLSSWASISSTADCFCLPMKLGAERWSVVFLLEWQVLIQHLHNLCFFPSKDWERNLDFPTIKYNSRKYYGSICCKFINLLGIVGVDHQKALFPPGDSGLLLETEKVPQNTIKKTIR